MGDVFAQLHYGGVPVPYAVAWSGEEGRHYVAPCAWFSGRPALCMPEARGQGKPRFGKPHSQRQRQVIAEGRCDLCGRPLKVATKVSLSHARPQVHAAAGGTGILQVEPLLHRQCAMISLRHCPSLKRDVDAGSVMIRQVTRHRVQCALMDTAYVEQMTGETRTALGHAKVELLTWIDRDPAWLGLRP